MNKYLRTYNEPSINTPILVPISRKQASSPGGAKPPKSQPNPQIPHAQNKLPLLPKYQTPNKLKQHSLQCLLAPKETIPFKSLNFNLYPQRSTLPTKELPYFFLQSVNKIL